MDADLKKLRKLTKYMREQGLLRVKTPEMELELTPDALFPEASPATSQQKDANAQGEVPMESGYTAEDTLFWSAPGANIPDDTLEQESA